MVLMPETMLKYSKCPEIIDLKKVSGLKLINEKISSMSLASTVDMSQSNRSNSGNG